MRDGGCDSNHTRPQHTRACTAASAPREDAGSLHGDSKCQKRDGARGVMHRTWCCNLTATHTLPWHAQHVEDRTWTACNPPGRPCVATAQVGLRHTLAGTHAPTHTHTPQHTHTHTTTHTHCLHVHITASTNSLLQASSARRTRTAQNPHTHTHAHTTRAQGHEATNAMQAMQAATHDSNKGTSTRARRPQTQRTPNAWLYTRLGVSTIPTRAQCCWHSVHTRLARTEPYGARHGNACWAPRERWR
jgi:hypothetical protein